MALIELGSPELLLLAPLFVTLTVIGHYFAHRIKTSLEVFHYPPLQRLSRLIMRKGARKVLWRGASLALKLTIVALMTFSLSDPILLTFNEVSETVEVPMVTKNDIAGQIILAVDVSGSMGLQDVYPSRLGATKSILVEFVENASEESRFGIVAFEREIVNTVPVTSDKNEILSMIRNLTAAEVLPCLEEFTDIGEGLQASLSFLTPYASLNKSSAVILVSDGFANYGYPNPFASVFQATDRAKDLGIPVHALFIAGIGQDSNDELMREVADETQGRFMDSSSLEELRNVLNIMGKYYVPTHEWSSKVELKTTIPIRTELGSMLMLAATAVIFALWVGNYRHYKTSF